MSNEYGFDFGSMSVTRTCQDDRSSVISIKTKKTSFSVRTTNNGSVRFFDGQGNECELINKEHNRG